VKKTPVYLITGFLGSGKTTLIKEILGSYVPEKRIAVIQNEFAPHNFDGNEIRNSTNRDFDLLEINNGSVFCVCLLSNFIQSFIRFLDEYTPDIVFFEASGLSDPVSIGEMFNSDMVQEKAYLAGSVCIVDASNFLKLEQLQQRMVHQLQVANHVILNKTDLVDDFQKVSEKIKALNPQARISISQYCSVALDILFIDIQPHLPVRQNQFSLSAEDLGRPDIKSVVFKTTKALSYSAYPVFLKELSAEMIRIKGYLLLDNGQCLAIQYSGNQLDNRVIERNSETTEIIAMGFSLSPGDVKRMYEKYCDHGIKQGY
jgi:G3E family GTPase